MLVIARKQEQVVMIGDDITIKVLSIDGDKVRLGFSAPRDVEIHRLEVWLARRKSKGENTGD